MGRTVWCAYPVTAADLLGVFPFAPPQPLSFLNMAEYSRMMGGNGMDRTAEMSIGRHGHADENEPYRIPHERQWPEKMEMRKLALIHNAGHDMANMDMGE